MNARTQDNLLSMPDGVVEAKLARQIAAEWGWTNPKAEVLAVAVKCSRAVGRRAGDILVDWGVIDEATRDRLVKSQPPGVQIVQHMSNQLPGTVLPYSEKLLALQNKTAFYDPLSMLTEHPDLPSQAVIAACKAMDAVLMLIESETPVLVFSSWDRMLAFDALGSAEKNAHPIVKASGRAPTLALGARNDISNILMLHAVADGDGGGRDGGARQWNVKGTGEPHEKELARVIDHAVSIKASDIAFIPQRDGSSEVRVRKFGRMIEPFRGNLQASGKQRTGFYFNADQTDKAINLLLAKASATTGILVKEPVDGQINYKSDYADAFLRLNCIPLSHLGDYKGLRSVSIRLFSRQEHNVTLAELNMQPEVASQMRDAMRMPQGLWVVSGPTGSGKSSTISAMIGEHIAIYGEDQKRLSVEDPIERHLAGITQINVPGHLPEDKRFEVILRAVKRHDPDMLWIGEVRDRQSTEFCVSFAITGHLAVTTTHAKNSISGYEVLSLAASPEMRYQVIEAMAGSIAQRLVPKVCPHCSEVGVKPTDDERHMFALNLKYTGESLPMPETITRVTRAEGCEKCDRGYAGELPLVEILPFTAEVKEAAMSVLNREDMRENRRVMQNARTKTILASGLDRMAAGEVDLQSILFF